jgi:hypothetical protein
VLRVCRCRTLASRSCPAPLLSRLASLALHFPSSLPSLQVTSLLSTLPCFLNPPLISDLSNRPSVTEKASKTFMFGGKDSLDMTFLLPSKSSFLSLLRAFPPSALTSHWQATSS